MTPKFSSLKFTRGFENKREKFERLPLKKFYTVSFVISITVIIVSLLAILVLPPETPLYYGFPQSTQQLSRSIFLFIPALISLIFTLFNAYLSIFLDKKYLKQVFAFSSILISILAGVTTIKIIFLVGNF